MTLQNCVMKTILFGFGGMLLTIGILMASVWPFVFKNILKTQLALTKGSRTYDMWVRTPLPMYIDIYLYNWTNPHESFNANAIPHVEQVGPYVFSEEHDKVDVSWLDNDTIKYRQYRKWIYHPELSNGSLSDNITNFNVIAVTIGNLCRNLNKWEKMAINVALKIKFEQLVVTKNVSQLLFEGFNDPILDVLKILKDHNISIPMEFDKFGWFYKRNMSTTADGVFTMQTGVSDIGKLGDVVSWNGQTVQKFYSGKCAKVQGSLGELWSPYSADKDSINLFAFDICSGIPLTSTGTLSLYDLSGRVFTATENVFDNGTKYPESACYCVAQNKCPASGVRDISPCRSGAPVAISFPHFYLADPSYRNAVSGLSPSPEKHAFRMALEKNTGVPLNVNARLQINLMVVPDKDLNFFSKVPHVYMPMVWFDQHATMTTTIAQELHPLSTLASYGEWALIGVTLLGGVLVALGIYLLVIKTRTTVPSQSETLLNPDDRN